MNLSGNEITLLLFCTGKDKDVIKIYVSDFGTPIPPSTFCKNQSDSFMLSLVNSCFSPLD